MEILGRSAIRGFLRVWEGNQAAHPAPTIGQNKLPLGMSTEFHIMIISITTSSNDCPHNGSDRSTARPLLYNEMAVPLWWEIQDDAYF